MSRRNTWTTTFVVTRRSDRVSVAEHAGDQQNPILPVLFVISCCLLWAFGVMHPFCILASILGIQRNVIACAEITLVKRAESGKAQLQNALDDVGVTAVPT